LAKKNEEESNGSPPQKERKGGGREGIADMSSYANEREKEKRGQYPSLPKAPGKPQRKKKGGEESLDGEKKREEKKERPMSCTSSSIGGREGGALLVAYRGKKPGPRYNSSFGPSLENGKSIMRQGRERRASLLLRIDLRKKTIRCKKDTIGPPHFEEEEEGERNRGFWAPA